MNQAYLNRIKPLLEEMVSIGYVSGVNCMILKDGAPILYEEAGVADLDTLKPIKRDSIFRLYSMSKPITSAAVMKLLEQGKLDLLDSVERYLPGFKGAHIVEGGVSRPAAAPVTIRTLLNMTSGVSYPGCGNPSEVAAENYMQEIIRKMDTPEALSTVEIANRFGTFPLAFEPGSHFRYGFSADILGAVVEVISGMRFRDFLKENLLDPLEMKDTDFYVPEEKQPRLTSVYQATDEGLKKYTFANLGVSNHMKTPPAFESGGAGLVSTIDDYSHFCQMLLDMGTYKGHTILSPATVRFMTGGSLLPHQQADMASWDGLPGFSYANLLRTMKDPSKAVSLASPGEYGWDGWLGAYMANDPANNLAMLMMYQRTDAGTTEYTRRFRNLVFSSLD